MNSNNNKDTIKVKYLTLTRLKAEYSNLLLIIVGYAALNQQLPGEPARDSMLKKQERAGRTAGNSVPRAGSGSKLNTACTVLRML